jgi:hypothetical protein
MRRARNRSTGTESGAQATQSSTGNVSDSGRNVSGTGTNVGATSTGVRDQPGSRTETTTSTQYARETAPQPAYGPAGGADTTEHTGLGGVISMLTGLLAFLAGLSMVVRNHFYPVLPGYAYRLSVDSWGWVLIALGILLFAAGSSRLLDLPLSRVVAVAFAVLTAIAGFMVLPYTPFWSILIVALSALSVWALMRRGRREDIRREDSRRDDSRRDDSRRDDKAARSRSM